MPRTRRGSKAQDDRQQGSGGEKTIGKRDAATRDGTQLRRVDSYVISMGTGLFTDLGVFLSWIRRRRRRNIYQRLFIVYGKISWDEPLFEQRRIN